MSSIITQALGDYKEDFAKLNFAFLTLNLTTGVPTALVSGVISVYKGSNTTQSVAGITLNADYDSVTGLNHVLIDLSADAFYAADEDYFVVITTGTVNSVQVVGTVVATFSIAARSQQATNAAILVDTAEIGTGGAGLDDLGGMSTAMKAEVNVEAKDVLVTDTQAELAQGAPAIVASLATMIKTMYKFTLNKTETTSTTVKVFNSDESTVDHQSTISDDDVTGTKGEFKAP